MKNILLMLIPLPLVGCHKDGDYQTTPCGFKVYDIEDLGRTLSDDEVLAIVDGRIMEFQELHPGHGDVAKEIRYYVRDHWRFESSSSEGATGSFDYSEARIDVALYETAQSVTVPETDKPWTIMQHPDTGVWHFGGDASCPALVFELERAIGMHGDVR